MVTDRVRLRRVKVLHTLVWAVLAGAIVSLYPAVVLGTRRVFWALNALVFVEIATLALFRGRCPLTLVAERYTDDRRPNFDIFLPETVARYNKEIFTVILLGAWGFAALRWRL